MGTFDVNELVIELVTKNYFSNTFSAFNLGGL